MIVDRDLDSKFHRAVAAFVARVSALARQAARVAIMHALAEIDRTVDSDVDDTDREDMVLAVVAANPGLSASELATHLALSPDQLARPIAKLLFDGGLRRKVARREVFYFASKRRTRDRVRLRRVQSSVATGEPPVRRPMDRWRVDQQRTRRARSRRSNCAISRF